MQLHREEFNDKLHCMANTRTKEKAYFKTPTNGITYRGK